jgi:hypothetical protein
MSKQELLDEVARLAKEAGASGELEAAGILYGLAGALAAGNVRGLYSSISEPLYQFAISEKDRLRANLN